MSSPASSRCRCGFARAGSLTHEQGRPPALGRQVWQPRPKAGSGPTRRIRRTHQEGANRMTALIQRVPSEGVAPHRSEPTAAHTPIWLTQHAASGTDSILPDCRMFHTKKGSGDLITKAPLTRSEHQGIISDNASIRLTHLVFPAEHDQGSPSAIGLIAALDTSVTSVITPLQQHGGGVSRRCRSASRNLACRGSSAGSRSPPRLTARNASSSSR